MWLFCLKNRKIGTHINDVLLYEKTLYVRFQSYFTVTFKLNHYQSERAQNKIGVSIIGDFGAIKRKVGAVILLNCNINQ